MPTAPTQVPGFADTLRFTNTGALGLPAANSNMNTEQQTNFMNAVQNARTNPAPINSSGAPSVSSSGTVTGANTTSPVKAFTPVVTSDAAQKDFSNKVMAYNTLLTQMKGQSDAKAKADLQTKVDAAAKDVQDANLTLQNKGLDIKKTEADAKLTAAKGLTSSQGTPPPGWDAQTYANFKAANPNLEPDQEDTARMQAGNSNSTGSNVTSLLSSESSALSGVQDQRQSAFDDFKSQVSSIMNGTFPLSATESALISATMASFDRQKADQTKANQANVGAVEEASFRSGGEYTPSIASGTLANAISQGISKIATLDAQAAKTVADLEQGFQTKDYQMVNDLYDKLDKQLSDKSSSIKSLFEAAISNEKDQRDFTLKQQQFQEQQKKDAADIQHMKNADYIAASGTWSLHDNPDGTQSLVNDRTGKIQNISPNNIVSGTGTPGNTGVPVVDNNTKYTSTGIPYVDGTNLIGKEAVAAQNQAASLRIPYMGKDQATALNNIEATRNDLNLISQYTDTLNPSVSLLGSWRLAVSAVHGVESVTQSGPGAADIASYKTFKESAIKAIQGLASGGTGLRINQAEIQTMLDTIPSYNDTKAVAQAKISKLNSLLTNNEKSMFGSKAYDRYSPDSAKQDVQTYYKASPDHAKQVETIMSSFPGINDSQIMQLVQP